MEEVINTDGMGVDADKLRQAEILFKLGRATIKTEDQHGGDLSDLREMFSEGAAAAMMEAVSGGRQIKEGGGSDVKG